MSATAVAMRATSILQTDLGKAALFELRDGFGQRLCGGLIDSDASPLETVHRAWANAADDHRVHLPACQRPQGIAGPMDVSLITVG